MSKLVKEPRARTHSLRHVPRPRAAEPALAGTVAEDRRAGGRAALAALAAALVAAAVVWGATSIGDGGASPTSNSTDLPVQYLPLTGGVPFGP